MVKFHGFHLIPGLGIPSLIETISHSRAVVVDVVTSCSEVTPSFQEVLTDFSGLVLVVVVLVTFPGIEAVLVQTRLILLLD